MHPDRARLACGLGCAAILISVAGCTSSVSTAAGPGGSTGAGPTAASSSAPAPSGGSGTSSGHASTRPLPTRDPAPLRTVPTRPVRTRGAVPLRSPAPFGDGVSARVVSITHGTDKDRGPGAETGRPTVLFHLRLTNGSARRISVATVQVNASYGSSTTPAVPATSTTVAFRGTLPPGRSAQAVYAFVVPGSAQGAVQLTVTYTAGRPTVLLTGSAR